MTSNDEQIRAAIAEQAGEWFVANEEGPLDARESAALAEWLQTSPVHIEEFLGVSAIARDLKQARTDPGYSLEAILARARTEEAARVQSLWTRMIAAARATSSRGLAAAGAVAACAVLSLGLFLTWNSRSIAPVADADAITAWHFATGHGEQLTRSLADGSVIHLNTDSAVRIRYSKDERLVTLTSGQAEFEVAHEPHRAFRVFAGSAEVVDVGTQFDVHLVHDATVVTVVEGRVDVGPSNQGAAPRFIELRGDQQISMTGGVWPTKPVAVDAQRATAWLRREIAVDHESLERVVTEYDRYADKPIEIATPALRKLQISGVFATDDPDAFIAFLRSLKAVRVEVTETRILVR